jgi:acetate kinase
MLVLTVNSGSSSVKLAAFEGAGGAAGPLSLLREAHHADSPDPREALGAFMRDIDAARVSAVAHRVVHGGTRFVEPVAVDEAVETALRELSELAPLHNPRALAWIGAARELCGEGARQIAAFDTAFFAHLPRVAAEYALPASAGAALGVRRYGFHGLAHEAMWQRWCELNPQRYRGGRIITVQLGGGCSMAAIDRGRPVDTTMGFSPLEGLVMATRSGDVDPAAVAFLAHKLRCDVDRVIDLMNHEAGLLGVSGASSDPRVLLGEASEAAQFAVELYCYRARKALGSYLAVLGGCEGIVFGGGVGEHMPEIRGRILAPLRWVGVELDPQANEAARGPEACISRPGSPIRVQVAPVDEQQALARAAAAVLSRPRGPEGRSDRSV